MPENADRSKVDNELTDEDKCLLFCCVYINGYIFITLCTLRYLKTIKVTLYYHHKFYTRQSVTGIK